MFGHFLDCYENFASRYHPYCHKKQVAVSDHKLQIRTEVALKVEDGITSKQKRICFVKPPHRLASDLWPLFHPHPSPAVPLECGTQLTTAGFSTTEPEGMTTQDRGSWDAPVDKLSTPPWISSSPPRLWPCPCHGPCAPSPKWAPWATPMWKMRRYEKVRVTWPGQAGNHWRTGWRSLQAQLDRSLGSPVCSSPRGGDWGGTRGGSLWVPADRDRPGEQRQHQEWWCGPHWHKSAQILSLPLQSALASSESPPHPDLPAPGLQSAREPWYASSGSWGPCSVLSSPPSCSSRACPHSACACVWTGHWNWSSACCSPRRDRCRASLLKYNHQVSQVMQSSRIYPYI